MNASLSDLQWTIDAYALSLPALAFLAGSLSDLRGHKQIFRIGLTAFTISSLICGVATDALFLILSRAAQGVGGAAMFAASPALLASEFRSRERAAAVGIWGAGAGASVVVGPLFGGVLASGFGWRWVFFVNVPSSALTLGLLAAKVGETLTSVARVPEPQPGVVAPGTWHIDTDKPSATRICARPTSWNPSRIRRSTSSRPPSLRPVPRAPPGPTRQASTQHTIINQWRTDHARTDQ